MKRSLDGSIKKGSKDLKRQKPWTNEEEEFLREEVCKESEINWRNICKSLNKKFAPVKRTANSCKEHWHKLHSSLTFNEELIVLLTLYRGNLEVARSILQHKVDIDAHIGSLVSSAQSTAQKIDAHVSVPLLAKLQFFVCVDLALNAADELFDEMRGAEIDWLEMVQRLTDKTEKMTREGFHQFAAQLVANIEEKINLLLTQEVNEIKEIMHERKVSLLQEGGGLLPSLRSLSILDSFGGYHGALN
eukprot:TRINITY_DN7995_c0_g1_i4.p1 TRINITY_DN7995_c0_g1~~TRINITY_DN7995_c0_g1_i4.p1  ORF type:complete len:246 (+),score=87.79 TRINITY_DN7995_c0_g1_i4:200-937(+)